MRKSKLARAGEDTRYPGLFRRLTSMKSQLSNPFRSALHDNVNAAGNVLTRPRRNRICVRILAAIVALALPPTQTATAVADEQVLEIPQAVATPTAHRSHHHHMPDLHDTTPATAPAPDANVNAMPGDPTAYANAGAPEPATQPTAIASNTESYPPDPNVGSINDYQNQPGENGQPPSFSFGGRAPHSEPPASMTTSLIVGGILVGMMALEIASAHHHHR